MEVINMTTGQRIECFSCNYGLKPWYSLKLASPWKPIFGVPLCVKSRKKMQNSGLRMKLKVLSSIESSDQLLGDSIIKKEFEFKPSFDEYLKAMESVKAGRGKKETLKKDQLRLGKKSMGSALLSSVGKEKIGKGESGDGAKDLGKASEVVEDNELGRTVSAAKFSNKERGSGELKNRMDTRESIMDVKLKRKSHEMKSDSLWSNGRVSIDRSYLEDLDKCNGRKAESSRKTDMVSDINSSFRNIGEGHEFYNGLSYSTLVEKKEQGKIGIYTSKNTVKKYGLVKNNWNFLQHGNDKDDDIHVKRAAFSSFDELNDVKNKPRVTKVEMEERVQKIAKCLNGADIDMPEWMFSKAMRSARIKYTDHTVLRVIQILGKLGNWRRVLQVIEWLEMRERYKSHRLRNVYTSALDVLGKARRPVEALNLYKKMLQRVSSYPDIVAYRSIAVTLGQAGYMKELFDVIDTMRSPPKKKFKTGVLGEWDPRLEPDIVVYNAVLNACVRRKQWEGAFWVMQQLKQQGLQPSTSTYGLIMEVMLVCEKYNLVHEFFRKVQKSSIPDALIYKILLNTLWREGKTDEAVSLVQDMERRGIVGSAALYYDLARCLCSAGRCQEALVQMGKICNVANKPLVVTYTGLIQVCLDSGHVQDAAYIFREMKSFCTPNLVTCNIMLKAYLDHGLFEDAKELFHQMCQDAQHISSRSDYRVRVLPDLYTFNTFLDACAAQRKWDDFEHVYKKMMHHGYHFNPKRHLRMVLDASRDGKDGVLELTWNHLVRSGRTPPPPLIKERFCLMLEKDDYDSAIACITSNPNAELQAFSKKSWLNLFGEKVHIFRKEPLHQLLRVLNTLMSKTLSPNPVLLHLLGCCKDWLRTHDEIASEAQHVTALKQ